MNCVSTSPARAEDASKNGSIRMRRVGFTFTRTDDTPSATYNAVDHVVPGAQRISTPPEREECRTSKRCRRTGHAASRAGAVQRDLRSNRQAHPPLACPSTGAEHAGLRPCAARRGTPAPGTSTTAQQQGGAGHEHFYRNHRIRPDGLEDNGRPAAEIVDCRVTEC